MDVEDSLQEPLVMNSHREAQASQRPPQHSSWRYYSTIAAATLTLSCLLLPTIHHPIGLPPIPPIRPHHAARVKYSSRQYSNGEVEYKREVTAPCEHGILLFSIGPARDDLPFAYDIYEDAYIYSDNAGLCLLYPTYTGYQLWDEPFWNPSDPRVIDVKPLQSRRMHRISSRLVNPSGARRSVQAQRVGDYTVVAKHEFYKPSYYQALKNTVNQWKDEDGELTEEDVLVLLEDFHREFVKE